MAHKNVFDVKEFSFYTNDYFKKTNNFWIANKDIKRQFQVLRTCSAIFPPTAFFKPSKTKMTKNEPVHIRMLSIFCFF